MKPLNRSFLPWLGALLLVGCGVQLEVAEEAEPKGTDFNKSLYEGYLELSRAEYQEGDYRDSDTFAERAIIAADGAAPPPEAVDARDIPSDKVSLLAEARDRLLALLDEGGIERLPQQAAEAQIKFECWMQEQEEDRQPDDIAACRTDFFDAMAYLETELAPKAVAAAETPAPAAKIEAVPVPRAKTADEAPAALKPVPDSFVVYFDFDQSKLSQESIAVLMEVVLAASKKEGSVITALGHTDSAGKQDYNQALARKRVEAVTKFLIESGVDKTRIKAEALGPAKPAVAAPDGQPEPKNRRVEIKFAAKEPVVSAN
ncbi:MAG: OmpA family protein [Kiloniellales bacterium]|nr:OmpA family protein [Kiloniellales bacterium]